MTIMSQVDKNLLLFLDPAGRYDECAWVFVSGKASEIESKLSSERNIVWHFSRSNLLDYFITAIKVSLGKNKNYKNVFFINDGLLSSFFYSDNISSYRAFSKNHLERPRTLRQWIVSFLPLVWRAESRYIVQFSTPIQVLSLSNEEIADLEKNDVMFFSNAAGKLLLLSHKTLESGKGTLVKTTANSCYAKVMAKEFDTVAKLSEKVGKTGCLPVIGKHYESGGRQFFTEEYIPGEGLHERLHELGRRGDPVPVCKIIDRLDEWFMLYLTSFSEPSVSTTSMYNRMFTLFADCYGDSGAELLRTGTELLSRFGDAYPGVIPITAHNDLWPGNIVMTQGGFTVIDWERATERRAPFFDYFWMVTSTVIEVLACDSNDFSGATRTFIRCEDHVSIYAQQKLRDFIARFGIGDKYFHHLMFLFLMELSVQGYQVLGRQTEVDRLAFAELVNYANNRTLEAAMIS